MSEKHPNVNRVALAALVAEALAAPPSELIAIRLTDERVAEIDLTPREALAWCRRSGIPLTRVQRGLYLASRAEVLAAVASSRKPLAKRVRREQLARVANDSAGSIDAADILAANGRRVAG